MIIEKRLPRLLAKSRNDRIEIKEIATLTRFSADATKD